MDLALEGNGANLGRRFDLSHLNTDAEAVSVFILGGIDSSILNGKQVLGQNLF